MKSNLSWRLASAALIGIAALALAGIYALRALDPFGSTRPFSSDEWKRANLRAKTRCDMVTDLQQRVGLVGKSKVEIEQMLGRPEHGDDPVGFTHYHLCPSSMDIYILDLRWENERIVSANVRDT